jgi:hypothetical protein
VFDLKARQMGGTTGIAAYAFWHAYFRPNFRVGVMAQSRESAEQIFEIYKRFYDNLPSWMVFPTEKSNVREILFFHGGMIRVFTANTQSARGTTYNFLHCSEFAFYSDVEKTSGRRSRRPRQTPWLSWRPLPTAEPRPPSVDWMRTATRRSSCRGCCLRNTS